MPEKRITVSGIEITVLRKKIKNMYLRVLPPDGRVQITAPLRAGDGQIRDFAQSRLTWIAAQKKRAVDRRSGWPERYETGTAMWLWGTPCRLEFQNGRAQSSGAEQQDWPGKNGGAGEFKERRIVLYADENSTQAQREKILKECGETEYHFYYPYPDYKFMTTLYSDRYLPKVGELSNNLRNFDRDRMLLFDEKKVFDMLIREGLFGQYSNSFLVMTGPMTDIVYSRFSNDRAEHLSIRTDILEKDGKHTVRKYPAASAAFRR